jgi:WD40 repeat protein/Tfp pilus assembly protein PilF/tRNA A-37 threonylcarbamoyl transferase component Bud32/DNA-directed RNA polymerase subunit RPC12/RpoP
MIELSCLHCGEALEAEDTAAGKKVKCPTCGAKIAVTPASSSDPTRGEPATLPPAPPDFAEAETLVPPRAAASESATLPPSESPSVAQAGPPAVPGHVILGELGRGGMGVVYKARQTKLGRVVALKMILAGGHAGEAELARFRTEAEAIARLQHPNIVQIYEVGEQNGLPYFSLEFCGGGSLEKELNGTPLPPKKVAALVEALARAMQAAHEQGVIHRDLKPANVLRTKDGTPKITDFGLAKKLDEKGQTATGSVMGTPSYMAPEQAGHQPDSQAGGIGPACDVYALGAILYECLTGRPPFKAATPLDTILQVVADEPVPPRQLQPRTPRDLETVCLKCLQKHPKKRYASAEALAADLRRFQAGEPIKARPVGRVERAAKWVRRNPAGAALLATLLLGTAAATLLAIRASQKAAEALEQKGRADEQKNRADQQAEAATANARRANDRAYISDLRLIQRASEENQVGLVHELLEGQRPEKTGGDDLRNFEWYYWWRTSHNELHTLQAHAGVGGVTYVVNDLAFSPDGRRLASCGGFQPGDVKVWDTITGQVLLTLPGHARTVEAVAFSPDGRRLVSGGERAPKQGEVKVWDALTGKELLTLTGLTGVVSRVAFSPDGRRLAGGSVDKTVKVWDAATGQEERTLQVSGILRRVVFSPDGRRLATLGGTLKVWDLATGQEERAVAEPSPARVIDIASQADGRCLAFGVLATDSTNAVKVWDAFTGQEVLTLRAVSLKEPSTLFLGAAFSPDCCRVASAALHDGAVGVWDTATGQELMTLRGHSGGVRTLAFSPDGHRLASGGTVQIYGKPATGEIKIWDVGTGPEGLTLHGHTNFVAGVAFSPDGRRLASTGDGKVKVWDAATGRETLCLRGDGGLFGGDVAFSPDGRRLASCGKRLGQPGEVRVWDAATGERLHTLRGHTGDMFSVAFSPDSSRLASRGTGEVKVWDAATGQEVFSLSAPTSFRHGVAFSPDGRRLASSCANGLVKVWDAATRQEVLTLRHTSDVDGVAYSPDGGRLAGACKDRTVRVWDLATGKEALTLRGHTQYVLGVTFSPDGRRLASCGGEPLKPGEVKMWDAASGQDILTLRGHRMAVDRVAFSSDGRRLASASNDATVKVWDATELTPEARQARLARFERPDPAWHLQEAAAAAAGRELAIQFHVKYLAGAEEQAPPFYSGRGQLYLHLGQTDKAVADFSRVIEQVPRDSGAWGDRAEALARLGEWDRAAADLRKTVELAPEDGRQWNLLARVSLAAGNADGYRSACNTLLRRLEEAPHLLDGPNMARTLVLAPGAVADAAQPLRAIEKAVTPVPKNNPYSRVLGAALYRAGKYDAAVRALNEAMAAQRENEFAIDRLFLAMAQHRLGHDDEAQKSLARALASMDEKAATTLSWESRLECDVVRKEAEGLIRAKDP